MENILLFSRCDLVHLYGRLNKYLSTRYNIINVAYSEKEYQILRNEYNISDITIFKPEISKLYKIEKFDSALCERIDNLFIEYTEGRFCLNSAIQSDRSFSHLNYSDCLVLIQVYYKYWDSLISSKNIKYFLHEPTAIFFTHMASILCKKYEGYYLSQIQVFGNNRYNWIFVEGDNGFPTEIDNNLKSSKKLTDQDLIDAEVFIKNFRIDNSMLVPELSKVNAMTRTESSKKFIEDIFRIFRRHFLSLFKGKQKSFAITDHVEQYLENLHASIFQELRKIWNYHFTLRFDAFETNKKYYYYPLHLEPEAAVLYWGEGIYKNQVKLIENIASQIPPNHFLYVKDHPHGGQYREIIDYLRIKAIPNVKLLHPGISGRAIIEGSKGVLTINGTSGFEAILLNKPVFVFGNSFYDLCIRAKKIRNIRDLREILYSFSEIEYYDDNDLFRFINAFLDSSHNGFISYFANRSNSLNIEDEDNAEIIANEMLCRLQMIG